MHSRTPPMEEARHLYTGQSGLASRLKIPAGEEAGTGLATPLVIWDVGLGAAANAMAAILCYEAEADAGPARPMHLISFENDLNPLRLAFLHNREFTYLRHAGIGGILGAGYWKSPRHPGLRWTLMEGDFLETLTRAPAPPDLIFFDMFSSQTESSHWTLSAFRQLFAACVGRPVELFTYTCSTPVRAALLVAGFHVAKGRGIADRAETTTAFTTASESHTHELLGPEWLARWSRSSAKFPPDLPADQQPWFEHALRTHPQFRSDS